MSKEKKEARIFERNPDTGRIRSRQARFGAGSAKPQAAAPADLTQDILQDIWAANRKVIDGKWYVELTQVCAIIGGRQ